jgi:5-(carboxyamino)imidazole ribonucleotide synthase
MSSANNSVNDSDMTISPVGTVGSTVSPILPGASLGVMGGGQLGRMFVHAAQRLGYATVVLDPAAESPAGRVAHRHIRTAYLDETGLAELAEACVAITTEFENVPASALERLAMTRVVAPTAAAVATCQDRAAEKAYFERCGIPCAPYFVISREADLAVVSDTLLPGILKTSRLGYDGKGQIRVNTRAELAEAWNALRNATCVLERVLPLATEVSVIIARNAAGEIVHFPVQQNLHRGGVLALTTVPVEAVAPDVLRQAVSAAEQLAASIDYVGVLCVEFFILRNGSLVANEMAPRPHNSGHYSIDACDVSQFELQVRAMTNLPLVAPRLHSPAVMLNLLGDLWFERAAKQEAEGEADGKADREADTVATASAVLREPPWAAVLAIPGVHLHLYGKTQPRRGRKMGHVTVTAVSSTLARTTARRVAALLGIETF